ncbi:MAG TPA: hypothetical protein DCS42_00430 [Nitrospiraceae bacterium]|nr:hypothetical protein [Nitrospiraceae bacterium]
MPVIYICDGCGKQQIGMMGHREFEKPPEWFQRSDKDGIQIACSRNCIKTIADKTGKTSVVLPV